MEKSNNTASCNTASSGLGVLSKPAEREAVLAGATIILQRGYGNNWYEVDITSQKETVVSTVVEYIQVKIEKVLKPEITFIDRN